MTQKSINGGGEVVLYEAPNGQIRLDVRLEHDTVWLSQAQMAELFGRERSIITKHVRSVFREGELEAKSVCANFARTAEDGKTYQVITQPGCDTLWFIQSLPKSCRRRIGQLFPNKK